MSFIHITSKLTEKPACAPQFIHMNLEYIYKIVSITGYLITLILICMPTDIKNVIS